MKSANAPPSAPDSDGPRGPSEPWRAIAIAGGAGMLVVMGLGRFSFTALVPALVDGGTLTALEAGWVGSANLGGFLLGALLAERARAHLGQRRLLALAISSAVILLFLSAVPWGFAWLAVCRGLIGVATSIVMIQSLAAIGASAPAERRPLAAGAVFAGVGLGIVAAGQLVPPLSRHSLAAAWLAVAFTGAAAMLVALHGWRRIAAPAPSVRGPASAPPAPTDAALARLLLAHGLFSFALVPHTLYWVDTIARVYGHGLAIGGWIWSLVGALSIVGPLLAARLATAVGTATALVLAFGMLALGVGAPALAGSVVVSIASSVLFGMQPGVSALMAARAGDLAPAAAMPRVMRAMILANAIGGSIGGILIPCGYAIGGPTMIFASGGFALLLATVAVGGPRRAFGRTGRG